VDLNDFLKTHYWIDFMNFRLLTVALFLTASFSRGAMSVEHETMTFQVAVRPQGPRGATEPAPEEGVYSLRGAETTLVPTTVEVIKVNNGLIEAWVAPDFGARLLRAFDVKTGVDYFNWTGEWNMDYLGFGSGGVEPSFPFFEHGVFLRQPAGHRVVRNEDGSVTVAMDMRFTQHQYPRDARRYGRFTEESLNVMVTVQPGSTVVEYRMRRENPTPLPRAGRLWNNATYHFPAETTEEERTHRRTGEVTTRTVIDRDYVRERYKIIFPARWVVDHGPTQVHSSPHHSNPGNWGVSHFAIDAPYGLMGVYDSREKVNFLRTNDPENSPAAKLYADFWGWRPGHVMVELWGGQGLVFEKPQPLFPAYAPVEAANHYTLAQGIGEVTAANNEIAVSVDGDRFELVAFRAGTLRVRSGGNEVAAGDAGPDTPLRGTFDGNELVVLRDGVEVFRQTFPLDRPVPAQNEEIPAHIMAKFEELKTYGGQPEQMLEMEQIHNNEGAPVAQDAIRAAREFAGENALRALSLARTCYRVGAFDEAAALAARFPGPEADFVLGLIALERGQETDFGQAGVEANYLRALQQRQMGNPEAALELVNAFLAANPTAYRPRLARAFWAEDVPSARALSTENPGSPEALMVLGLLGEDRDAGDLETLLAGNPEAREQVEAFRIEITEGRFMPLKRYAALVPAKNEG
jgi:hypothetical protein